MLSDLCDIVLLSPNTSGKRADKISRLTPHCFVGQVTAKRGCEVFQKRGSDPVSSNYVIGFDGSIGGCVDEDNRAWTSSSRSNDNKAITIEIASDTRSPYSMTNEAIDSLVRLTIDIMKRNNKNKLVYISDKNTALNYNPADNELLITFHRWFANKSCPGPWFISICTSFVERVNKEFISGDYCMVEVRVCKLGDNNESVKALQSILKSKGYKNPENKVLKIDGDFGPSTEFCVKNYQRDIGFTGTSVDGIVGPKTWSRLLN